MDLQLTQGIRLCSLQTLYQQDDSHLCDTRGTTELNTALYSYHCINSE